MARNGRFGRFEFGLRVLVVLAAEQEAMMTSAAIAERLGESAVMVRRAFLQLHAAGLITQRKGPNGGAMLKRPAKEIGLGDILIAMAGEFARSREMAIQPLLKRAQSDAVKAMNETTLSQVVKRIRKDQAA